MAKTKTPFFSLGSSGSISNALTTQKRGSSTLVRAKPTPTDPYSLPQAYQRWDYQDYAHLWTLQSEATKQTWRSLGSRNHQTGLSAWMAYCLTNLPQMVGRWRLDKLAGAICLDSSRNGYNGTVFGCLGATGAIGDAYYFDGIDDRAILNVPLTAFNTTAFTVEIFIMPDALVFHQAICSQRLAGGSFGFELLFGGGSTQFNVGRGAGGWVLCNHPADPPLYIPTHLCGTYDGVNARLSINGVNVVTTPGAGAIDFTDTVLAIGRRGALSQNYLEGIADHAVIHSRVLDQPEIIWHSARRYPV